MSDCILIGGPFDGQEIPMLQHLGTIEIPIARQEGDVDYDLLAQALSVRVERLRYVRAGLDDSGRRKYRYVGRR